MIVLAFCDLLNVKVAESVLSVVLKKKFRPWVGGLGVILLIPAVWSSYSAAAATAETNAIKNEHARLFVLSGVKVVHRSDPTKPKGMAIKYQWMDKKKQWEKQLMLYNGMEKPETSHAVWKDLDELPKPTIEGSPDLKVLFYKSYFE